MKIKTYLAKYKDGICISVAAYDNAKEAADTCNAVNDRFHSGEDTSTRCTLEVGSTDAKVGDRYSDGDDFDLLDLITAK